jgi:hypothetical protein
VRSRNRSAPPRRNKDSSNKDSAMACNDPQGSDAACATVISRATALLVKPLSRLPRATGLWTAAAVIAATVVSAVAEVRTVERAVRAQPGKDVRIGVYVNVRPDCTSGPLPGIRLIKPPPNGTVAVKKGKVTATNYKQCLALQVPAFVAYYRSRPEFNGRDIVDLEVKYSGGRVEIQRIRITVGRPAREEPI